MKPIPFKTMERRLREATGGKVYIIDLKKGRHHLKVTNGKYKYPIPDESPVKVCYLLDIIEEFNLPEDIFDTDK